MTVIAENRAKTSYFIVIPLLRIENIKERWKKTERYIQIFLILKIYIYSYP